MGTPTYMRSVVDRNIVMRCIPVLGQTMDSNAYYNSPVPSKFESLGT